MTKKKLRSVRCAIYTRKSSEEGLEQEFNSLHAQREACESYVLSQKHEGWIALHAQYDDGGFSGGSMQRPALEKLLEDIKIGKIDVIVVYKIDRLTRSLADFAKMVELLDKHDVSFVSVTQQFNTKTSMGRLTLNVLLSFAQFEREVTGERIRDKIAASKMKGMWMGGNTPMGYDVGDRELIVNERDAETVRHIFRRYADLQSVTLLQEELQRDGITTPVRTAASTGRQSGGRTLARGALYHMLQNRIYLGEIVHKGTSYPGKHPAIIDQQLWDKVQSTLQSNRVRRRNGTAAKQPSLLAGLLYDGNGNRFTASHAVKKGRRYRYYIRSDEKRTDGVAVAGPRRIPAADIEHAVASLLHALLSNDWALHDAALSKIDGASKQSDLLAKAKQLAARWADLPPYDLRSIIVGTVTRIDILEAGLEIKVDPENLLRLLQTAAKHLDELPPAEPSRPHITLRLPVKLKRCGMEMKLVVTDKSAIAQRQPDPVLVTAVVKANSWWNKLTSGEANSIHDLATQVGSNERYVSWVLRLKHLAPDMIEAILDGSQPPEWRADTFIKARRFPFDWNEQRRQFSFLSPR